jgi:phage N-6-adenine-methyltransferase
MKHAPVQKPGKSEQVVGTPWELIRAVEKRWGKLKLDLAASDDGSNAKAPAWFGPTDDYLSQEFVSGKGLPDDALCWCNPPFANIRPWAKKWREDSQKGARIIALVPLTTCGWFADEVEGHARVIGLVERVTFEGHTKPYPKDCMLLLYGKVDERTSYLPGFETWRWKL